MQGRRLSANGNTLPHLFAYLVMISTLLGHSVVIGPDPSMSAAIRASSASRWEPHWPVLASAGSDGTRASCPAGWCHDSSVQLAEQAAVCLHSSSCSAPLPVAALLTAACVRLAPLSSASLTINCLTSVRHRMTMSSFSALV